MGFHDWDNEPEYDWDPDKERRNIRRHGIEFEEAKTVVDSPFSLDSRDEEHPGPDERWRVVGWSSRDRILLVVVSVGGQHPRIISARRATKRERDAFHRRR